MLEDFVRSMIPTNDKFLPYVDQVLDTIEEAGVRGYKPVHRSKAQIHTWLAWQEKPGIPMGIAIKASLLKTGSPACQGFAGWLGELFC